MPNPYVNFYSSNSLRDPNKGKTVSWINGMAVKTPQYDDDIGQLTYVAFIGQWDIGWNQSLWGHISAHWELASAINCNV